MNILIIPSWYPDGEDQLMGIYHKEYALALAKTKDIHVNILYIERERLNAPFKYLRMKKEEITSEEGYNVYIKRMLNLERISKKLQLNKYVKVLDKAFKKYLKTNPKPDIIHAMVTIPAGYAACVLSKKYNIPVLVTEHASYFDDFFNGYYKQYGNYVLANAYFSTVSKYMIKEIKSPKKIYYLPNLVDTNSFSKIKRKEIPDLKIVNVSALRKGKRIEDLISSLKLLRKKGYKATLTIVGDGYLREYYEKIATDLNLNNYVNFVGRKTKEEIVKILGENNIFVIPSVKETFGIPGIEALASGMPVVSTKCLGPEEYIDNKCGKLVPIKDVCALAKAIEEVYLNKDKYDIKYLRSVANKFSSSNITKLACDIYREILGNKN